MLKNFLQEIKWITVPQHQSLIYCKKFIIDSNTQIGLFRIDVRTLMLTISLGDAFQSLTALHLPRTLSVVTYYLCL